MFSANICNNYILFSVPGSSCQELVKPRTTLFTDCCTWLWSWTLVWASLFSPFTSINSSDTLAQCLGFWKMNLRPKASICLIHTWRRSLSREREATPREGKAARIASLLDAGQPMAALLWNSICEFSPIASFNTTLKSESLTCLTITFVTITCI